MPTRIKPVLQALFGTPGTRYTQTHEAWGSVQTAREMHEATASLSEDTRPEDFPIISYHNIVSLIGTAAEADAVSGFVAAPYTIMVPGVIYLDAPIDAFAINLQPAATQTDLRYWTPVGQTATYEGWIDKIEFPTGGWPMMVCLRQDMPEEKPDRDTIYTGFYCGLTSRFSLPPNPQFALGLWVLPNIRMQGMVPATSIQFGYDGVQTYTLVLGGDNRVELFWRHATYTRGQHTRLPVVQTSSVKTNSWASPGREGRHVTLEVWCVGHGVAVTTDRFQSMTYFRLPHGEPDDGHPYGNPMNVPASGITVKNNTGQFGVQLYEYRAPCDTDVVLPWVESSAIRLPFDPTETRLTDPLSGPDGYPPIEFTWKYLGRAQWRDTSAGNRYQSAAKVIMDGYLQQHRPSLRVDELVWRAAFKPSDHVYEFSPDITRYLSHNLRSTSLDPITFMTHQTPLLWSVAYGQKATVIDAGPFVEDTALSEQDIIELSYTPGEGDAEPSGSVQVDNAHHGFRSRLEARGVTQVVISAGWETPGGSLTDENPIVEAMVSQWSTSQEGKGRAAVSGVLRTIMEQLDDQRITGTLRGGEGYLVSVYLSRILEAFGLHLNQYNRPVEGVVTAGLEALTPTGELIDVARLNVGPPDKPLWTPEVSRGVKKLLEDVLLYSGGAGLWLVPYDWGGGGGTESIITSGCPYCHRHRTNTSGETHYWANHLGPRSSGCLAWDAERVTLYGGDLVNSVDYPCYTRTGLSTLSVGENLGFEILGIRRDPVDLGEKYYNHLIVKGTSIRLGRSRDQVAVEWKDAESINGTPGYEFALGYRRTMPPIQRDWITSEARARIVASCVVAKLQSIGDTVTIKVPLLSAARVGEVFSIAGGEEHGINNWKCRITEVPVHIASGATGVNRGTTELRGVKIGTITA